jgi:hypothetical protein
MDEMAMGTKSFRPVLPGSTWLAVVSVATLLPDVAVARVSCRGVGNYNKTNLCPFSRDFRLAAIKNMYGTPQLRAAQQTPGLLGPAWRGVPAKHHILSV